MMRCKEKSTILVVVKLRPYLASLWVRGKGQTQSSKGGLVKVYSVASALRLGMKVLQPRPAVYVAGLSDPVTSTLSQQEMRAKLPCCI